MQEDDRGYEIRESSRAKRLSLAVHPGGHVTVTRPLRVSLRTAERFVEKHEAWIEEAREKFKRLAMKQEKRALNQVALPRPRKGSAAYKEARQKARGLVTERLEHFNRAYGFRYGTISIRDQKTRWGSCSAAGNLSFNYRIVFLPPALQDYIVVHELCHAKEHNHSPKFWAQMARTLPEHAMLRKELRTRYSS